MPAATRRARVPDEQLMLPLAWLGEDDVLAALRAAGVADVARVRFRDNRSRLISLSADRVRLNLHTCFRAASPEVLAAIAAFASARGDTLGYRRAIERMRAWHEAQVTEEAAGPSPTGTCSGTPAQLQLLGHAYRQLNRAHFGGALPDVLPVRLSDRMTRRLGHVQYGRDSVTEIALNIDLLLEGNEGALVDTLLHEMAHAEAWLRYGHRGHGRIWRSVAARVGCEARACSDVRIRRRRRGYPATTRVPVLPLL
ncbi:MAG TPA: SprT family zinc-dependent metalloprotease [Longimicrobiales bacterium]|nr:SprT family zinc-dependent metalloprotease [Longimicrobiales bacterium]